MVWLDPYRYGVYEHAGGEQLDASLMCTSWQAGGDTRRPVDPELYVVELELAIAGPLDRLAAAFGAPPRQSLRGFNYDRTGATVETGTVTWFEFRRSKTR